MVIPSGRAVILLERHKSQTSREGGAERHGSWKKTAGLPRVISVKVTGGGSAFCLVFPNMNCGATKPKTEGECRNMADVEEAVGICG